MKQVVYILLALMVGLSALTAQQNPISAPALDDESVLRATIDADFKEGIFERVQTDCQEFLSRFPKSNQLLEVQLIEAKAQYFQGHYLEAAATLSTPSSQLPVNLSAEYRFWQGECLLQAEKWPEAETKYRQVLNLKPTVDLTESSKLGLAWSLFKQGKQTEAQQLLAHLQADLPLSLNGQRATIFQARIFLSKSQFKEAEEVLDKLLTSKLSTGTQLEANYWLGEIAQAENRLADAVAKYSVVTSNTQAFPRSLVAQAWFGSGICQYKLQQYDPSMASLEKAFRIAEDEQIKYAAFKLYLQCAQKLNRQSEAEATLRDFAKQDQASAPAALFAIGSNQADQKQTTAGISTLQALLTAYPDSPWSKEANEQLGDLYKDNDQNNQALQAYQSCLDAGPDLAQQQEVYFKMGLTNVALTDWSKATLDFQKAVNLGGASTENALFNLLQIQARQNDLVGFTATEAEFNQQFPKSPLQPPIILAKARLLMQANQVDKALKTYQDALTKITDPTQRHVFLMPYADLLYDAGQYEEAIKMCDELVKNFPQDEESIDATYKGLMCNYQLKRLPADQLHNQLLELYNKFPQNPRSAKALFTAAEFSYNAKDYASAQLSFEKLANVFPQSDLANQALLFAGSSATQRLDYVGAVKDLEAVKEDSNYKIDARLQEGNIYFLQLNYPPAIALFLEVLKTVTSGPKFVEANLALGQCYMALSDYETAISAFGLVMSSNQATLAQWNQAACSRGACCEKTDRPADALALYLQVLDGKTPVIATTSSITSTSSEPLPPEIYWRITAGQAAVKLRTKDQNWPGVLEIYRTLEQIDSPLQNQFHELIGKLRQEHFLYDDQP